MRKLIEAVFITLLVLSFSQNAFAVFVEGRGSAVIQDGMVKEADKNARDSALKNALRNFFSSGTSSSPEVTTEFLKFITKFRIISRSVSDNTVSYVVSADVDDTALGNVDYIIKEVTNSAVFVITGSNQTKNSDLLKTAESVLKRANFTTGENTDFIASMPDNPTNNDIVKAFSSASSQFLFVFTLTPTTSLSNEIYTCEAVTFVKVYSKDKEFPAVKVTGKAFHESESICVQDSFKASAQTAMDYVRQNFIPLPEKAGTLTKYTIKASGFAKFADVKSFMDFMKQREILKEYSIKTFSLEEAVFEADTIFSRDSLLRNLQDLKDKYGYTVEANGNDIMLNFIKGTRQ